MRKVLLILFIMLLAFGGYILYDTKVNNKIPILTTEEQTINIDNLYIYGNHFNMHGSLIDDENLQLVLYDGKFIEYDINRLGNEFNLNDNVNDGLILEKIPVGNYYLFLRSKYLDENNKEKYKYYVLNNMTEYKETVYYTFSNIGNKIIINSDNDYGTIMFNVSKNNDEEIYDVVVDAGHGGIDSGANKNGHREADYTMKLALSLKEKLEENGVKVKLTREDGQLALTEKLPDYGIHGRAVIPFEVKSKYLFSIHLNSNGSSSVNGLEVYTAANINYDFARTLASNIKVQANTNYSNNKINKMFDGVYTRVFTERDVENSIKEYADRDMKAYNFSTKSNYYFMIRETGGIVTGAYVDDRNDSIKGNPYYNSNVGVEAYLLELGYLTNNSDINNVINNIDKYTAAIADTFKAVYEIDYDTIS